MSDNVGYRKPPASGQFKPGSSGNPSGRPKGFKSANDTLNDAFNKELNKKVNLDDGSKITKAQALARLTVNGALKGEDRKILLVFKITGKNEKFNMDQKLMDKLISDGTASKNDIIDFINGNRDYLIAPTMSIIVNDQKTKDEIESLKNTIT